MYSLASCLFLIYHTELLHSIVDSPRRNTILSDNSSPSTAPKHTSFAVNLGTSWIRYGLRIAVTFFLSPFLVGRIGLGVYGVWTILNSIQGYMQLSNLGLMGGSYRYIAYYISKGDLKKLSETVNSALAIYLSIGVLLLASAWGISQLLETLFPAIPREMLADARIVIVLFSGCVVVGFASSTMSQVIVAADRFDLRNAVEIGGLLADTVGVVAVLLHGGGIVGLSVVKLVTSLTTCAAMSFCATKCAPKITYGLKNVKVSSFKEMYSFGVFSFIGSFGSMLNLHSDSFVIGAFVGPEAVAVYSIGMMLSLQGREFVAEIYRVYTPTIYRAGARADLGELRELLLRSSRLLMLLAVPMCVGFLTLGKEFIHLWMGDEFKESYLVLQLLAVSQLFFLVSGMFEITLKGMGLVRPPAFASIAEGVVNMSLSIAFVGYLGFGIQSIAAATLIAAIIIRTQFIPRYTCARIKLPIMVYFRDNVIRWVACGLLFFVFCSIAVRLDLPCTWLVFFCKVSALCAIYAPIGLWVGLPKNERTQVLKTVSSGVGRLAGVFAD